MLIPIRTEKISKTLKYNYFINTIPQKNKSNNSSLVKSFNTSLNKNNSNDIESENKQVNDEILNTSIIHDHDLDRYKKFDQVMSTEFDDSPLPNSKLNDNKNRILQTNINSMKKIATLKDIYPKAINLSEKIKNKYQIKGKMKSPSSTSREKVRTAKLNTRATNPNSLLCISSLYMQKHNRNLCINVLFKSSIIL